MFYFLKDYEIANYADDTTPYSAQRNHQFVIEELEKSSAILFKWLGNNFMKVNTDKSYPEIRNKRQTLITTKQNQI